MTRRGLVLLLLLLLGLGGALRWWLARPQAQWDPSPDTLVLEIASHALEGGTYRPRVQIWGDGRITWQQVDGRYVEGRLAPEAMRRGIKRVIAAGAFDRMLDAGGGVTFQYLQINLLGE